MSNPKNEPSRLPSCEPTNDRMTNQKSNEIIQQFEPKGLYFDALMDAFHSTVAKTSEGDEGNYVTNARVKHIVTSRVTFIEGRDSEIQSI